MKTTNKTDTRLIENLAAHLAVFPDWNLNDGEVRCRFIAGTEAPATFEMDVLLLGEFRRPGLATAQPPEYCVTIRFSGVRLHREESSQLGSARQAPPPPHISQPMAESGRTHRDPRLARRWLA